MCETTIIIALARAHATGRPRSVADWIFAQCFIPGSMLGRKFIFPFFSFLTCVNRVIIITNVLYVKESVVRELYKTTWTSVHGEELLLQAEDTTRSLNVTSQNFRLDIVATVTFDGYRYT